MAVKSICGAILISTNPQALARFYAEALGLSFEREDHGDLALHWGVDIGRIHLGIHPPENVKREASGGANVVLAFDVPSLEDCQARLERLGAPCVQPPHDEGFGMVASFNDPDGNQFELVELTHEFKDHGA